MCEGPFSNCYSFFTVHLLPHKGTNTHSGEPTGFNARCQHWFLTATGWQILFTQLPEENTFVLLSHRARMISQCLCLEHSILLFFRPPAVHTQTTEQLRFVIILVTQSENPKVVSKVAG